MVVPAGSWRRQWRIRNVGKGGPRSSGVGDGGAARACGVKGRATSPLGRAAANLELVADPAGISQPVHGPSPVVAGLAGQREVLQAMPAAISLAAQVFDRSRLRAPLIGRIREREPSAAVAASSALQKE